MLPRKFKFNNSIKLYQYVFTCSGNCADNVTLRTPIRLFLSDSSSHFMSNFDSEGNFDIISAKKLRKTLTLSIDKAWNLTDFITLTKTISFIF